MTKNILLSVSAGSLGHVLRMIALNEKLQSSNFNTFWILDGFYSNLFCKYVNCIDILPFTEHQGKVRDSKSLAELFWRKGHDATMVEILKNRIKKIINKYKIEFAINDIILSTAIASKELSIPCMNVVNDAQFSDSKNEYFEYFGIYKDIAEYLSEKPFIHAIPSIKEWYELNNPKDSKDSKDALFLGWLYPNKDVGFFSSYNSNQPQIHFFGKQKNSNDFRKDIYYMGDVLNKTKYIIHNSGLNTCLAAIAFNVYSFLVPQTWEQEINANKVISIGAGERYSVTDSKIEIKPLSYEALQLSKLLREDNSDFLMNLITKNSF